MKAHINGVDIFFDVDGAGVTLDGSNTVERPTVVAMHGGPALDHTTLKPWLTPLTEVAQIVYIDHRGTGRSAESDPSTYRLEQIADDIEALRHHLGLERIALLGTSYGGFISLTYALRYPGALSHLILVGTSPSHRFWERSKEILNANGTPEQRDLGPKLLNGEVETEQDYRHWWKTMLPLYYVSPDLEEIDRSVRRVRGNVRTAQEMLRHYLPRYDVEPRLGEIDVPTLVVSGVHDWIQPTEQSHLLAEQIPNAELALYELSGHMPYVEENARFIADVKRFLARRG